MLFIKFLNGDLLECETVTDVYTTYGIHPSQLELIENEYESTITHFGFIHPKPRVWLSQHHIVYNIPTTDDDFDPWSNDNSYVYQNCHNTSILSRRAKIKEGEEDDNKEDDKEEGKEDINTKVWSEIAENEQVDPGIEYSERYWLSIMCRNGVDRDVIQYAIGKLRALETTDEVMFEAAIRSSSLSSSLFSIMSDLGITHPDLWFECDFHNLDFTRILPYMEEEMIRTWRVVGEKGRTVNVVHTFEESKIDKRLQRLASLSTSDEVMMWFTSDEREYVRSHYSDLLCRNPNERIVDYYNTHPQEIKWASWIENTNVKSLHRPISLGRVIRMTRNGDVFITGRPASHHLLHILSYFSPAVKVPLTVLVESFGQNDDVEVVFDTDICVSFLNGEKMWMCPSDRGRDTIRNIIAKRKALNNIELICMDDDDTQDCEYNRNYFALIENK